MVRGRCLAHCSSAITSRTADCSIRGASEPGLQGRKRVHDLDVFMADIVADRLVRYLDRLGYVVMKKPPLGGHSNIARGPLDKK